MLTAVLLLLLLLLPPGVVGAADVVVLEDDSVADVEADEPAFLPALALRLASASARSLSRRSFSMRYWIASCPLISRSRIARIFSTRRLAFVG